MTGCSFATAAVDRLRGGEEHAVTILPSGRPVKDNCDAFTKLLESCDGLLALPDKPRPNSEAENDVPSFSRRAFSSGF